MYITIHTSKYIHIYIYIHSYIYISKSIYTQGQDFNNVLQGLPFGEMNI